MTTYSEALDEIFTLFNTQWNSTEISDIVGYIPEIVWQGVNESIPKDRDKFWVYFYTHILSDSRCAISDRAFDIKGFAMFELTCPNNLPDNVKLGRLLSEKAYYIFKGKKTNNVWFTRVRLIELNPVNGIQNFHVEIFFEYIDYIQ